MYIVRKSCLKNFTVDYLKHPFIYSGKTFTSSGNLAVRFLKYNFGEKEGFMVYILRTPWLIFKVFSLEMDVQQAAL